jgi:hypothetical protein
VNTSLFDRRRAERFAQLVDEANGGRRHHTRSRLDDQLAELVTVGQQLGAMPISVAPAATFKRDLRAMLIATAEREGIGVTAISNLEVERTSPTFRPARAPRQARARGAIVVGIAAGTLALSGVSVASGEAMPGDALYGVKRSTEKAQLALASSDLGRGQLYLEFARTRLQEAHAVRATGSGFAAALQDMDSDTELGVKLLTSSAVERRDTGALDAVDRFVTDQRMLVAQLLDVVSTDHRGEVTTSLTLLDAIEKRSAALRLGLACNAKVAGDDKLGPMTGACSPTGTGAPSQLGARLPGSTEATRAPANPYASGAPSITSVPSAIASPSTTASAPADGAAEDDESGTGLLDGLGRILGGLFGG